MSVVTLDHVTLRIGNRKVLADVSFNIEAGEFIGVLGPNGAGKTTLMRAILGLLGPEAGSVKVFGHKPRRGNPAIGYLPQLLRRRQISPRQILEAAGDQNSRGEQAFCRIVAA